MDKPPQPMASEEEIGRAARIIQQGGLVAFPTETVYGLGANALDEAAVQKIFSAKGRPRTSPLIVHVASVEQARGLVAEWPSVADVLGREFWPGPLTLVMRKAPQVPDAVTAGLPTVGIRMPSHPVALRLLELAGVPIAAPSANKFMGLSPTLPEHVRKSLGAEAEVVLEGGASEVGLESTVLSLVAEPPMVLRLGGISREQIASVVGSVTLPSAAMAPDDQPHVSPGMHQKHYSPRTPLIVWHAGDPVPSGRAFWLWRQTPPAAEPSLHMPADSRTYARFLYQALHEADEAAADLILVEAPPQGPDWEAIWDRLRRAVAR